jgi:hypothetical protein
MKVTKTAKLKITSNQKYFQATLDKYNEALSFLNTLSRNPNGL